MVLTENKRHIESMTRESVLFWLKTPEMPEETIFTLLNLNTLVNKKINAMQKPKEGRYKNLSAITDSIRKNILEVRDIVIRKKRIPNALTLRFPIFFIEKKSTYKKNRSEISTPASANPRF